MAHIQREPSDAITYQSFVEGHNIQQLLAEGDAAYLRAMVASAPDERATELTKARAAYAKLRPTALKHALRWWARDEDIAQMFPGVQVNKANLLQVPIPDKYLEAVFEQYFAMAMTNPGMYSAPELAEYRAYSTRGRIRMEEIDKALAKK
jgi:hypothetical protein